MKRNRSNKAIINFIWVITIVIFAYASNKFFKKKHVDNAPKSQVHKESRKENIVIYYKNEKSNISSQFESSIEEEIDYELGIKCSSTLFCNMAQACINNKCVACQHDNDCLVNEVCAYGKCFLAKNVTCRSKSDCYIGECIVNGIGYGARNNEGMLSSCSDYEDGNFQMEGSLPELVYHPDNDKHSKMLRNGDTRFSSVLLYKELKE